MPQPRYDLENIFTYHTPHGDQQQRYHTLRTDAKELARTILEACPESCERSLALTNLEQAIFWANASIARNGAPKGDQKGGAA